MARKQKSKKARKKRTFMAGTLGMPALRLSVDPVSGVVLPEEGSPDAKGSSFSVEMIQHLIERIKAI